MCGVCGVMGQIQGCRQLTGRCMQQLTYCTSSFSVCSFLKLKCSSSVTPGTSSQGGQSMGPWENKSDFLCLHS